MQPSCISRPLLTRCTGLPPTHPTGAAAIARATLTGSALGLVVGAGASQTIACRTVIALWAGFLHHIRQGIGSEDVE
jgi:hypothetical protein